MRKLCVECRHHSVGDYTVPEDRSHTGQERALRSIHLCAGNIDLITGKPQTICPCDWMRYEGAKCGLDGRLWEPCDA